ncbi:kinase-like domain-containing protein [Fomes fomentarius]|nr:kinase-like domain-containing protein [Fomes fomentarius]
MKSSRHTTPFDTWAHHLPDKSVEHKGQWPSYELRHTRTSSQSESFMGTPRRHYGGTMLPSFAAPRRVDHKSAADVWSSPRSACASSLALDTRHHSDKSTLDVVDMEREVGNSLKVTEDGRYLPSHENHNEFATYSSVDYRYRMWSTSATLHGRAPVSREPPLIPSSAKLAGPSIGHGLRQSSMSPVQRDQAQCPQPTSSANRIGHSLDNILPSSSPQPRLSTPHSSLVEHLETMVDPARSSSPSLTSGSSSSSDVASGSPELSIIQSVLGEPVCGATGNIYDATNPVQAQVHPDHRHAGCCRPLSSPMRSRILLPLKEGTRRRVQDISPAALDVNLHDSTEVAIIPASPELTLSLDVAWRDSPLDATAAYGSARPLAPSSCLSSTEFYVDHPHRDSDVLGKSIGYDEITVNVMRKLGSCNQGRVVYAGHHGTGKASALKMILAKTPNFNRDALRDKKAIMCGVVPESLLAAQQFLMCVLMWEELYSPLSFLMPSCQMDLATVLLNEEIELSWPDRNLLCKELLYALCALRNLGVLHLDIKPSNILIDRSGRAVLSDFDMAISVPKDEYETWRGYMWAGTPNYRAPEMLTAPCCGYGTNAGVWSMGLVFLEIFGYCSGAFFCSHTLGGLMKEYARRLPIDPSKFWHLDETFCHLMQEMLQVDPSARISVRELDSKYVLSEEWKDVRVGVANHEWKPSVMGTLPQSNSHYCSWCPAFRRYGTHSPTFSESEAAMNFL